MKNTILILIASILFHSVLAQQWKNYTSGLKVSCIVPQNDTVWIGTEGGLSKLLVDGTKLAVYTNADGLGGNEIQDMAIDAQGNKWIAAINGVTKFDGTNFTKYHTGNSAIPRNDVFSIAFDSNENMWLGCTGVLIKYDGTNWTTYNPPVGYTSITNIVIDKDNTLWLNNSIKFDGSNFITTPVKGNNLAIDSSGIVWTSISNQGPNTPQGIGKYDNGTWTIFTSSTVPIPPVSAYSVIVDESNTIWFGFANKLVKYDGINWTTYTPPTNIPYFYPRALAIDDNGNKWLSALFNDGAGVIKFDGTNWEVFNPSNSPLDRNLIHDLAVDKHGNKWFLTYDTYKFDDNEWTTYPGNNHNIVIDKNDIKWFANGYDLTRYNGSNWNEMNVDDIVGHIATDASSNIWYTSNGFGLFKFDGTNTTWYTTSNSSLPNNDCWFIASNNKIWLTTDAGLSSFDGINWQNFTTNNGLPSKDFTALSAAPNGDVWFGTEKGLTRYNGSTWTTYDTINSGLPGQYIWDIAFDKSGKVWIASENGHGVGVSTFDGTNWYTYNINNSGISSNKVYDIFIDAEDNKWFGGNVGVSVLKADNPLPVAWLRASGEPCTNSEIVLDAVAQNMTAPYTYNWQSITGSTPSCITCQNPSLNVQQDAIVAVTITDNNGISKSDTLHLYACVATGISKTQAENLFTVYPNPASKQVNIQLLQTSTHADLNIRSLDGKVVLTSPKLNPVNSGNTISIDVSSLQDGIYLLELATDTTVSYRKLVIQH